MLNAEIVNLRSKLPAVGTTIFTVMSKLAADVGAINLSQGFPDFACDPALVDAVTRHMSEGRNQYAPMQGLPALREAVASILPATGRTIPSAKSPSRPAAPAIFDIVSALVHPGDEVVVFEPCYDSYVPAIELNGGKAIVIPLRCPAYAVPWDEVRAAVGPGTRLMILNSPHNPTATILGPADLAELARIVEGTDIAILSDEVYEHIIFDGVGHESLAGHEALRARGFIVGSFGKTYHVTGWKVGYVAAPAALTAEFRKVHSSSRSRRIRTQHVAGPLTKPRLSELAGLRP